MAINQSEYEQWRASPATKAFFALARSWENQIKDEWGMGHYTGESEAATIQMNAEAIGKLQVIRALFDIAYEDILEGENAHV